MAEGQLGQASFQVSLSGVAEFLAGLDRMKGKTVDVAAATDRETQRITRSLEGQIRALEQLKATPNKGANADAVDRRIAALQAEKAAIEQTMGALRARVAEEKQWQSLAPNSERAIAARIARLREERSLVEMNSQAYRKLSREIAASERMMQGGALKGALAQGIGSLVPGAAGIAGLAGGLGIAGATAALGEGVRRFAEFDAALRQLGALSGASEAQLQALKEAIAETARTSGIGKVQLAGLGSELARTGFSAQEIAVALKDVVAVAQATGESVETAAGVVGQALKLWNLPAEQAGKVGDMLAKSANLSATSLSSLSETLKYVGPAASSSNQSLADVVTLTTLLAEAGIKGSMAGTGLTAVLTRLKTASAGADSEMSGLVRGNAKRVQAFEQIGAAIRNANGEMRPLLQVLPEIKRKLAELTPQDRDLIANALFGEEGGRSFLALVNQSTEKMQKFSDEINNSSGEAGALQKQTDGLARTLQRSGQAIGTLLEKLGELAVALGLDTLIRGLNTLLDGLSQYAGGATEAIRALGGALASINPALPKLLAVLGAGTLGFAAAGPIGAGVLGTIAAIGMASQAQEEAPVQAVSKRAKDYDNLSKRQLTEQLEARRSQLRVISSIVDAEGEIGKQARARAADLQSQVKAMEEQLQLRVALADAEEKSAQITAQYATDRLSSYEKLTDLYREQLRIGSQIVAERGGIRIDALNARLDELEKAGQGGSENALALKREILAEEQAIARQKLDADRQALQYEQLRLGYTQQRARIEAQLALTQAESRFIQAQDAYAQVSDQRGSREEQKAFKLLENAAREVDLLQERLGLLQQEQAAERQNLSLRQELLNVEQQRKDAQMERARAALGTPDPGLLELRPGESTGVLLKPDPSLTQELSSAYEGSTSRLVDGLVGTLGQRADAQTQLLAAIAQKETSIVVNVDSAGGVNTYAGMG